MDNKELADKVIACGIGRYSAEFIKNGAYFLGDAAGDAEWFVNDGRVVIALMEKVLHSHITSWKKLTHLMGFIHRGDAFKPLILETCCNILENEYV